MLIHRIFLIANESAWVKMILITFLLYCNKTRSSLNQVYSIAVFWVCLKLQITF